MECLETGEGGEEIQKVVIEWETAVVNGVAVAVVLRQEQGS